MTCTRWLLGAPLLCLSFACQPVTSGPEASAAPVGTSRFAVAGDGVLEVGEACDDGNTAPGDGCDATGQLEPGYVCQTVQKVVNGGFEAPTLAASTQVATPTDWTSVGLDLPELHSESFGAGEGDAPQGTQLVDLRGDTVSAAISQDLSTVVGNTYVVTFEYAANLNCAVGTRGLDVVIGGGAPTGFVANVDFNTSPWQQGQVSFVATAATTSLQFASTAAELCGPTLDAVSVSISECANTCGNGALDSGEACDDGDTDNGDGCSTNCQVETDYGCAGTPSVCTELDADSDGVGNLTEDALGTDRNDSDSDDDGLQDNFELSADNSGNAPFTAVNTDGNGLIDALDTDSDDDGIPDSVEADGIALGTQPPDFNTDGVPNYRDDDSDGDGILDSVEAGGAPATPVNSDGTGKPDYLDLDSDDDTHLDAVERGAGPGEADTDADALPDYLDLDSDNDCILDENESNAERVDDALPAGAHCTGTSPFCDTGALSARGAPSCRACASDMECGGGGLLCVTSGGMPFQGACLPEPTTTLVTMPPALSNDATPDFDFSGAPSGVTFECRVDADAFTACTPPHTLPAVADGAHTFEVRAVAGNLMDSTPASHTWTVDTTAPAAPVLVAPLDGATTSPTPVFSGTAEADAQVEVRVDGNPACTDVADSSGEWSCTPGTALGLGARVLVARATDAAGNVGPDSTAVNITVAVAVPPGIPVVSAPLANAAVATTTPTFSGQSEPGTSVEVSVDGTASCSTTADGSGNWSCVAGTALSQGAHSVTAVASNTFGSSAASAARSFTVDTVPPGTPAILEPVQDSQTSSRRPPIRGIAEPNSALTLRLDGAELGPLSVDANGAWAYALNTDLTEGAHEVSARATDGAGNAGLFSSAVRFTVDTQAPASPQLDGFADGASGGPQPTFRGSAEPGSHVSVRVNGVEACSATATDQGTWTCTPPAPLPSGTWTVEVIAVDPAGNASTPQTRTYVAVRSEGIVGSGLGCSSAGGGGSFAWAWLALAALALRPRREAAAAATGALCLALAVPATVQAQTALPRLELERLQLNPSAQGSAVMSSGDLLPQGDFRVGLLANYARNPLGYSRDGVRQAALVSERLTAHLTVAWGALRWLEVGAQLPFVARQRGDDLSALGLTAPRANGLGTPWLYARANALSESSGAPLDVGFGMGVSLPVGSAPALARGNGASATPHVGLGKRLTPWLRAGVELGALLQRRQSLGTLAGVTSNGLGNAFNGAVSLHTVNPGVRGELTARTLIPSSNSPRGGELLAGVHVPIGSWVELHAMGGPGLGGYPGIPQYRVLAGVTVGGRRAYGVPQTSEAPPPADDGNDEPPELTGPSACVAGQPHSPESCPELDLDGDTVLNADDRCPEVKGALGHLRGCPDRDFDGVADLDDPCPDAAGKPGRGGCPSADADDDGVLDEVDLCPNEAGVAARKGCPVRDADKDGVEDRADACPKLAGLPGLQGCPDTDGDRVPDNLDNCRTRSGPERNYGCPAKQKQQVFLTRKQLVLKKPIRFVGKKRFKLSAPSQKLLAQAAEVLKEHFEIEKLVVAAHTDNSLSPERAMELTTEQAELVRDFLVKKGVQPHRLEAKGMGAQKPLASNDRPKGRALNRRIELLIAPPESTEP